MTKKHFIALANALREHNKEYEGSRSVFHSEHFKALADFLASQNPKFDRERWLDYVRA